MAIAWNLELDEPSPTPDEAEAQAAKLQAELAKLTVTAPTPEVAVEETATPEVEEVPDSQESLEVDPLHAETVYTVQANANVTVQKLAEALVTFMMKVPDLRVRTVALARAMTTGMVDPDLLLAALSIERQSAPRKGDRVQEENGSIGTVVAIRSLSEVIVKWDHEPRAMRTSIQHITLVGDEDE